MDLSERLESILPTVVKPARYTGNEWNSVRKDWSSTQVKVALAYPDVYDVGMSNLGLQILYDIVNGQEDCLAERVYAPWLDMEARMRGQRIPLFSLESRRPLAEFDLVGFTLQYELTYTNILNMLDLAGLPLLASQRDHSPPFVIGGGCGAYNPEPLADFFDLFVVGDGEEAIVDLLEVYRRWSAEVGPPLGRSALTVQQGFAVRREFLRAAARIPGVYVPSFYDVSYTPDEKVAGIAPNTAEAPAKVAKRWVKSLEDQPAPVRPVIPYIESIHDRGMIEIQRGCTRGCRFCQAGILYRPIRERSLETALTAANELLRNTGYEEISLVSLSTSDYSHVEELVRELTVCSAHHGLTISLPSLRIDAFSVELAKALGSQRRVGLTFAPEAGSQRLRDVINKGVTEEDLLKAAEAAFGSGWSRVKLYFMVGLPGETLEDVEGIAALVRKVVQIGRQHRGGRAQVAVSVATFVPKPHTPFQWSAQVRPEALREKQMRLRDLLRNKNVSLSWHDPATSFLEGALARGDRRLGRVVRRAWELGAKFDAWTESFQPGLWDRAFQESGLEMDFYNHRQRDVDEVLPWDHLDAGVSKKFLRRESRRSSQALVTPDCRTEVCPQCGLDCELRKQKVAAVRTKKTVRA